MYIRTEAHMDARTIMHAQVCEKFKVIAPDVDHAGPMWVIFAAGFLTGALMHACMHACVRTCVQTHMHHTCTENTGELLRVPAYIHACTN